MAIVVIAAGLWLGSRGLVCFDQTGHPDVMRGTAMAVLGSAMLLAGTALVVLGIVSIVQSVAPTERWRYGVSWKRPTRVVDTAPVAAPTPAPEPAPSSPPAPLTGDSQTDYYSGALRDHSLAHWSGFWCEIFLMADNSVVIAHDESTHHYFRTWTLDDVIAGRSGILFDENQQDERSAFDQRVRQQRG